MGSESADQVLPRVTEAPVRKRASSSPVVSPKTITPEPPEEPENQEPEGLSRRDFLKRAAAVAGVLAIAGTGLKVFLDSRAEGAATFDLNKLDKPQKLVIGESAQIPTSEDIDNFINAPKPVERPNPQSLGDLPIISIIPSIDMQNAGEVNMWRASTAGRLINIKDNITIPIPGVLLLSIENPGTSLGIQLPEGVNTKDVEMFKMSNIIIEKFKLGEGKYIIMTITSNDIAPTEAIKDAPIIDSSHPRSGTNWIGEVMATNGSKQNIDEKPAIFLTKNPQGQIVIDTFYLDSATKPYMAGGIEPAIPHTVNGKVMVSAPNPR